MRRAFLLLALLFCVAWTHGSGSTSYTLTVTSANGTVTSSPGTINCGSTCTNSFSSGTVVTLTAVASSGYTFSGWSGAGCSGTGTCIVTMSSAQAVTASYTLEPVLTV